LLIFFYRLSQFDDDIFNQINLLLYLNNNKNYTNKKIKNKIVLKRELFNRVIKCIGWRGANEREEMKSARATALVKPFR